METLDRKSQRRVKEAADALGPENLVVIVGSSDSEGARIYAKTVTAGDPNEAGPLAGVQLGLPVYHVLEDDIKAECALALWAENVGMMERVLDKHALAATVSAIRAEKSRFTL